MARLRKTESYTHLSRRETQIMDAIYRLGQATVAEVVQELPDPPSYNSVRVILGILEQKRHVKHREDGARYLYRPAVPKARAQRLALRHLLRTFFAGSPSKAIATLLGMSGSHLSKEELSELEKQIRRIRRGS